MAANNDGHVRGRGVAVAPQPVFNSASDLERLVQALLSATARRAPLRRLAVKREGRVEFIDTASVRWVESCHNNIRLHLDGDAFTLHMTLGDLLARLDTEEFIRVNRGAAVNVTAIASIEPAGPHKHVVVLRDGTRLNTTRRCRQELRRLIYNSL